MSIYMRYFVFCVAPLLCYYIFSIILMSVRGLKIYWGFMCVLMIGIIIFGAVAGLLGVRVSEREEAILAIRPGLIKLIDVELNKKSYHCMSEQNQNILKYFTEVRRYNWLNGEISIDVEVKEHEIHISAPRYIAVKIKKLK